MSAPIIVSSRPIEYPDSDGLPMSDNTLQFQWIVTIKEGLEAVFRQRLDVFVAGDLLWYPVEGRPDIRTAPDTMAVFGRPKGHRGSYQQWEEGGVAPQVVFEVTSPGNRLADHIRKFEFYQRYGVEEYYLYDPDRVRLEGWKREGEDLREIPEMHGWVSPRLGVRFDMSGTELQLFGPDGQRFVTYVELAEQRDQALRQAEQAVRQAEQAVQQAEQERQRAERLAAQLRALGIEPPA